MKYTNTGTGFIEGDPIHWRDAYGLEHMGIVVCGEAHHAVPTATVQPRFIVVREYTTCMHPLGFEALDQPTGTYVAIPVEQGEYWGEGGG